MSSAWAPNGLTCGRSSTAESTVAVRPSRDIMEASRDGRVSRVFARLSRLRCIRRPTSRAQRPSHPLAPPCSRHRRSHPSLSPPNPLSIFSHSQNTIKTSPSSPNKPEQRNPRLQIAAPTCLTAPHTPANSNPLSLRASRRQRRRRRPHLRLTSLHFPSAIFAPLKLRRRLQEIVRKWPHVELRVGFDGVRGFGWWWACGGRVGWWVSRVGGVGVWDLLRRRALRWKSLGFGLWRGVYGGDGLSVFGMISCDGCDTAMECRAGRLRFRPHHGQPRRRDMGCRGFSVFHFCTTLHLIDLFS